ncbi:AAT-domain-containing protein [Patellaria atrata CBS 101060]|uniref:AAT-domain-containing protein n=1 Tax=Patellaria atrata CBS 101060 TaxID=1346257 RepID=A0A9P4S3A8_9PEZI|nr:AAT-domain-containing protein [Patellaria atrata CBS 101060]
MLEAYCSGTPYEIGLKHGKLAKAPIARCIDFYMGLFEKSAKLDWDQVQRTASQFESTFQEKWPTYLKEMQGIADGAGVKLIDILAINVRTEIAFGLFSDGCTSVSFMTDEASYIAQNWDWARAQKDNILQLTIEQTGKPTIKIITEAGLIGKIGLNSAGVGICFNAIRAQGMDPSRVPCHVALRMALECSSMNEAVQKLDSFGVASSSFMLIADPISTIGLEWSSIDVQKLHADSKGWIYHSNHYLLEHPGVHDTRWVTDSLFRIARIKELRKQFCGEKQSIEGIKGMLKDEMNFPAAICRAEEQGVESETLFSIVMNLTKKRAEVTIGRPTEPREHLVLEF